MSMKILQQRLALRACMILAGITGLAVPSAEAPAQGTRRPRLVTADPGSDDWESNGDTIADKPKPRLVRYVVGDPPPDDPGGGIAGDPGGPGTFEWTVLTPSLDSRMIYVSSSMGNDASDGSRGAPVRTILHARTFLREGSPDWILLRRGDVFREGIAWWNSGRSQAEPMVITNYGDDAAARPVIAPPLQDAGFNSSHPSMSHLAFVGLHFRAPSAGTGKTGIVILNSTGEDVLIEDCRIEGFKDGIVLQRGSNMRIRGNAVVDSAAPFGGHSQGMYALGINGLTVEGNVFDHNGWREDDTAVPTIFNHNIYVLGSADDPSSNVVIRNNVLSRASSFGIKIAAHDPQSMNSLDIKGNLFLSNGNGCRMGDRVEYGIVDAEVSDNVFTDIGRTINTIPQSFGLLFDTVDGALVERNYFVDKSYEGRTFAIQLFPYTTGLIRGVQIRNNIAYDWRWASIKVDAERVSAVIVEDNIIVDFGDAKDLVELDNFDPARVDFRSNAYFGGTDVFTNLFRVDGERIDFSSWMLAADEPDAIDASSLHFVDPDRSVPSYMESLALEPSREAFINAARTMSRESWDSRFTAASVIRYIADGFRF